MQEKKAALLRMRLPLSAIIVSMTIETAILT